MRMRREPEGGRALGWENDTNLDTERRSSTSTRGPMRGVDGCGVTDSRGCESEGRKRTAANTVGEG